MKTRRYPVGIQTFSEIIRGNYVYVDKTDLMWQMQWYHKFAFLSRPRRFGKSLLSSTFEAFFRGEKDLFEGLKVMDYEKDWISYPVLHLDFSMVKGHSSSADLSNALNLLLSPYETRYGSNSQERTPWQRFSGVINRAFEQTGKPVVVLIDEYDSPLLSVLHRDNLLSEMREVMTEFFQPLKANDAVLRFCFLTGITRISQLNIFSTLNNLSNLSLVSDYAGICGITESELQTILADDIHMLAEEYGCSDEEMEKKLKMQYDGYHFASRSPEIYNPFSLLSAFVHKKISNYWFDTGTPTFLIHQMKRFHTDITSMDDIETTDYAISRPTEAMTNVLPLLYQTGYLTIKRYDREGDIYTLSIPNREVRVGYADGLLPAYSGLEGESVQAGFALKFWRALKSRDTELALQEMKIYLATLPYIEGFKKKLAEAAVSEGFYEYTLYLIFSMLNVYVSTQVKCHGGRIDLVIRMPEITYIFELKTSGTAVEALQQINEKGYAIPFSTNGNDVVKVGILFDVKAWTLRDWIIQNET